MRNAVHYEVGPLTTVCPPVLIIAVVDAIPTLSRICGSWLYAAQTKYDGLISAGFLRGVHYKRCYNKEREMQVRQNHPLKIQGTAVRGQKALAGGGYAGKRLRSWVFVYKRKRHHIMATAIAITCWVCNGSGRTHLTVVTC